MIWVPRAIALRRLRQPLDSIPQIGRPSSISRPLRYLSFSAREKGGFDIVQKPRLHARGYRDPFAQNNLCAKAVWKNTTYHPRFPPADVTATSALCHHPRQLSFHLHVVCHIIRRTRYATKNCVMLTSSQKSAKSP